MREIRRLLRALQAFSEHSFDLKDGLFGILEVSLLIMFHDNLLEVILILSVYYNITELEPGFEPILILTIVELLLIAEFKIEALGLHPVRAIDLLYFGLVLFIPDVLLHKLLHPLALHLLPSVDQTT